MTGRLTRPGNSINFSHGKEKTREGSNKLLTGVTTNELGDLLDNFRDYNRRRVA